MSIRKRDDRGGVWQVRWREGERQRSRMFSRRDQAEAFDRKIRERKRERSARLLLREAGPEPHLRQDVYVVVCGDHVKIGLSGDSAGRLSEMQIGSPTPLAMAYLIRSPDAARLERALHERYKAHHHTGEWYEREPVLADLNALAALGVMMFTAPGE